MAKEFSTTGNGPNPTAAEKSADAFLNRYLKQNGFHEINREVIHTHQDDLKFYCTKKLTYE